VDAAHLDAQGDLVRLLQVAGLELVLDTNAAELATAGRYDGQCRHLPWARSDRPLIPSDFSKVATKEFAHKIARFAIERRMNAILAPTRLLQSSSDSWIGVDAACCEALRDALDAEGGRQIEVDFPLHLPLSILPDEAERAAILSVLSDLPFQNLWLRISGFGADATPIGVRRYINAARDFHRLDKPLIADCVGGLAGIALAAFGAIGGIAHGITEKERFNGREWLAKRSGRGGGGAKRILLGPIDLQLYEKDAAALLDVRGAKALLACNDPSCCPRSVEDMLKNHRTHFLIQRSRQVMSFSNIHVHRRAKHFLDHQLAPAERAARKATRLNFQSDYLANRIRARHQRLDDLRQVLESLHEASIDSTMSPPPAFRGSMDTSEIEEKG
jgi:hypothetical protein